MNVFDSFMNFHTNAHQHNNIDMDSSDDDLPMPPGWITGEPPNPYPEALLRVPPAKRAAIIEKARREAYEDVLQERK